MAGPLVLVGPPGAGKTSVGALLARKLGRPFRDTDQDIEVAESRTVGDIFTTDGEQRFRELEEWAIELALREHTGVLAVGGGAVLSEHTRGLLRGHTVVFLNVGLNEGIRRTGLSTARPLLVGVYPRATFKALLDARLPLYREVATVEVLTDDLDPAAVAEAVLLALAEKQPAEK
ncbi:MAG TPA: shikimate kinase [Pseudonocardiaceae bacterium]